MAVQKTYSPEDLKFAGDILKQTPDLERKIKSYWQRFNCPEYNAKPIEEKARDIDEFYYEESLIVHPVDLGVLGLAVALALGADNLEATYPAGPLIRVDFYYRRHENRKLQYGDIIGEWMNKLLRKSDDAFSQKFSQENFSHYILNGKSRPETAKQLH